MTFSKEKEGEGRRRKEKKGEGRRRKEKEGEERRRKEKEGEGRKKIIEKITALFLIQHKKKTQSIDYRPYGEQINSPKRIENLFIKGAQDRKYLNPRARKRHLLDQFLTSTSYFHAGMTKNPRARKFTLE